MDSRPRERSCSSWFRRWHAVSASLASMVVYIIYLSLHSKSHSDFHGSPSLVRGEGKGKAARLQLSLSLAWSQSCDKVAHVCSETRSLHSACEDITGAGLSEFFPLLNVVQACQRSVCAQLRPFEHSIGI